MISAIALGGDPLPVNPPSILIVIGDVRRDNHVFLVGEMSAPKIALKAIATTSRDPSDAAVQVLQVAEMARKNGVLSLQGALEDFKEEPFLYKGMAMVVDGTPGEEVENIMRRDMMATLQRHGKGGAILKKMAEFAPAMGLIGTLIGLVQMLGNLQDPASIGPSMAVALLTTFYGAVLANMVLMPMASKLERNSEEALVNSYVLGAASIGRQENPRRLEMLLNSVLSPAKRVAYFD